MEAVIVAGGFGTRVWPLTERHPKHLLPVAGLPFVVHQIAKLAAAGVDHVVLATSYRAEAFAPVLGDGSAFDVRLTYVTESEPLGTAGAIRNASQHLGSDADEPVVVLNGDLLSGHDIAGQLRDWHERRADVSLLLVEVADPRSYGSVPTDRSGRVVEFAEKSPDPITHQINGGCYVFRRDVIGEIPAGRVVSVERETFPELLESGRLVVGFVDSSYWLDVGTPTTLVQASRDLVLGTVTSPAYDRPAAEALAAPGAVVRPGAVLRGGTSILPGAEIGPGATVDGSIVMAGALVGAGATVTDSVVAAGASIGERASLVGAAIGDDAVVGDGCALVDGAKVGCAERVDDGDVGAKGDRQRT